MIAYFANDAGAPVLSGTVGSLIALLTICLVDGYGAKAGAGWTKPYVGTNLAAFRAGGGALRYLRIDDTFAQYSAIRGYGAMTDVDTGTELFPSGDPFYAYKSNISGATARNWIVLATNKYFVLFIGFSAAVGVYPEATNTIITFGDITSYLPGDAANTILIGNNATSATGPQFAGMSNALTSSIAGHSMYGDYLNLTKPIAVGKHSNGSKTASGTILGNNGPAFPDPITGGLLVSPIFVHENTSGGVTRGVLDGVWAPLHTLGSGPIGALVDGTGPLVGKQFRVVSVGSGFSTGKCLLEISDTWGA